jgi:hypothetical protein
MEATCSETGGDHHELSKKTSNEGVGGRNRDGEKWKGNPIRIQKAYLYSIYLVGAIGGSFHTGAGSR